MATAKKETVVIPAVRNTTVTLTLTEQEAHVLHVIFGMVGGDPSGYRGCADDISEALETALGRRRNSADALGLMLSSDEFADGTNSANGSIYFPTNIKRK